MMNMLVGTGLMIALAFSSVYVFYIWWQVRGLLGALLVCIALTAIVLLYTQVQIYTCVEYTAEGISAYYACNTRVPLANLRHIRDTAILLIPVFMLLAHDAYAARHNGHRAITTKLYHWFAGMRAERVRNGGDA